MGPPGWAPRPRPAVARQTGSIRALSRSRLCPRLGEAVGLAGLRGGGVGPGPATGGGGTGQGCVGTSGFGHAACSSNEKPRLSGRICSGAGSQGGLNPALSQAWGKAATSTRGWSPGGAHAAGAGEAGVAAAFLFRLTQTVPKNAGVAGRQPAPSWVCSGEPGPDATPRRAVLWPGQPGGRSARPPRRVPGQTGNFRGARSPHFGQRA